MTTDRKPLTTDDVVAFVGRIGLAEMQGGLTNPDDWPTADATFEDLSNSSRWACIRLGMETITAMCGKPRENTDAN